MQTPVTLSHSVESFFLAFSVIMLVYSPTGLARPYIPFLISVLSLHRFRIFQRRRFFSPCTSLSSHVRLIPNLGSSTYLFYASASPPPSLLPATHESHGLSDNMHLIRSISQKVSFYPCYFFCLRGFLNFCLLLTLGVMA
jgi:hypothetical protein